jgi:hypothetical protein
MVKATATSLDEQKKEAERNAIANRHRLGDWIENQGTLQSRCMNGICRATATIGTLEWSTISGSATWANKLLPCPYLY